MVDRSPNHEYWDAFYAGRARSLVPDRPSDFAKWSLDHMAPYQTVVEVGFGNARDSLWLAGKGHPIRGYDFAESAVALATARSAESGLDVCFKVADLYDTLHLTEVASELAEVGTSPVMYGRFLLHALEDIGRWNLFDLMAKLPLGCSFLFEFRTGQDANAEHVFGDDHYRRFLDPQLVIAEIEERGGTVTFSVAGHGYAIHKSEDPHVARLVGQWRHCEMPNE